MGIFSKAKEKDELVLVFNIGSSAIGGALFYAGKSGIPKIIFSISEPILIEETFDINRFLFLTIKSLEVVASKIHKAALGAPARVYCVLSSSWYMSQTRQIELKKNVPFIFNEKLADSLIQKEINLLKEELSANEEEGNTEVNNAIRTIELKNIKTTLNGYETDKPLDQKIKELEMTIFVSMSGERILKSLEEAIEKYFQVAEVKFSSFVMASFVMVRDLYAKKENFLLVDVGGEITDISIVKKNMLRESTTFPSGRNFLTRGIARELGCSLSEAASLLSLLKDGHAEEQTSQKLLPILNQLRKEWLDKFQECLASLSGNISVPSTIYITVDKDLAEFFKETIKAEQFSQYSLTDSKFEIIFLNKELLHGTATFEDLIVRDPFIIIDSVYINRLLIQK